MIDLERVRVGRDIIIAASGQAAARARVIDHLRASLWFPAGTVVLIAVIYGSLAVNGNDIREAALAIGSMSPTSLFSLLGVTALLTVLTQMLEFQAIRLLEGYWGAGLIATVLSKALCSFHIRRRRRLEHAKAVLERRSFSDARSRMLQSNVPQSIVEAVAADILGEDADRPPPSVSDAAIARTLDWRQFARPSDVGQLHRLIDQLLEYPAQDYRILPTRLGNTLRVHEEVLSDTVAGSDSDSLDGMLFRAYDELPASVQKEHDRYRSLLDLYCTMVVIFVLAAFAAIPLVVNANWKAPIVAAGVMLLLARLSYESAIVSARGYGVVLKTVSDLAAQRSE